jgi:HAD superfamily hydrolase (TIGR01509 family)
MKAMKVLKLVIFDCDGVLVDSEPITNQIFLDILQGYGLSIPHEEFVAKYVGSGMSVVKALLYQHHNFTLPDDFFKSFNAMSIEALERDLKAVKNVEKAIDDLNVPFCVASNSSPEKVRLMLKKTTLFNRFDGKIFTSSLVAAPKPAPDIYLHAAKANGVSPENVLVIEDTHIGVTAAVAAGMNVFGYTGTFPAEKLINAGASKTFGDMNDLTGLIEKTYG